MIYKELSLSTKLSPQDLDEVMQRLKLKDININLNQLVETGKLKSTDSVATKNCRPAPIETIKPASSEGLVSLSNHLQSNAGIADTSNTELDSTFIADTSSNNLNVSAS